MSARIDLAKVIHAGSGKITASSGGRAVFIDAYDALRIADAILAAGYQKAEAAK